MNDYNKDGLNEKKFIDNENDIDNNDKQICGKPLWNPKYFIIISFLFSFLSAAILYSLNYGRCGFTKKRTRYLLGAVGIFIAIIFVTFNTSSQITKYVFMVLNVSLGVYMQKDQTHLFEEHIENGGKKASFIIPLVLCIALSAVLIGINVYYSSIPDTKITYGEDELYYTNRVNKEEIEKLGEYLSYSGFFVEDNHEISAKIDKKSDKYIFSFPINEEYLNDEEVLEDCREMTHILSTEVFEGHNVEMHLCDTRFKNLKTIK